jgi:oligoendopeptidase F
MNEPTAWRELLAQLATHPSATNLEQFQDWLERWDALEREINEHWIELLRRRHADTRDSHARNAFREFESDELPALRHRALTLQRLFLERVTECGWHEHFAFTASFVANLRLNADCTPERESAIARFVSSVEHQVERPEIIVDGKGLTPSEVRDVMLRGERENRERVWTASSQARLEVVANAGEKCIKVFEIREEIARDAGSANFQSFYWQEPNDFTPTTAERFQTQVLKGLAPITLRLAEQRRGELGVERLRPWDLEVGTAELRTNDNTLSGREALERVKTVFKHLGMQFDAEFEALKEHALDLEWRLNKSNQGFMAYLPRTNAPSIFMTYRGNTFSLATLVHELGHAVHATRAARGTRWSFDFESPTRASFSETIAFVFELISLEGLSHPDCGLVSPEALGTVRREKATRIATRLRAAARVELVEHFVYSREANSLTTDSITEYAAGLEQLCPDGVDRTGVVDPRAYQWIQPRSLTDPFSLGLYGRAAVGALLFYSRFRRDQSSASAQLEHAIGLPRSLPDHKLYEALGIEYPFSEQAVQEALDTLAHLVD